MQVQAVIPVGIAYEQMMEDFRAMMRHEIQTHASPPATSKFIPAKEPKSARQIAEQFGVCVATVWEWARVGKIASHKIGGRTFFFAEDILDALETKQRSPKKGR